MFHFANAMRFVPVNLSAAGFTVIKRYPGNALFFFQLPSPWNLRKRGNSRMPLPSAMVSIASIALVMRNPGMVESQL
ncbi:MAG: hypothetical protein A2Z01_09965 [Betaproteobacteria bacterium RBG_16_58_11]|nr:MAG: hypothetical protein A2Z01_09965 [Betaproteobacteria bacterium RBG_16_58_11]